MIVVLDTNVLVSGLLRLHSNPGEILRQAASGIFAVAYDVRMLDEYQEVLKRPELDLDGEWVEILLVRIRQDGLRVTAQPLPDPLPDPDDEPFLGTAVAAGADYLVTGNIAHYPSAQRCGINVVGPTEFLAILRKRR